MEPDYGVPTGGVPRTAANLNEFLHAKLGSSELGRTMIYKATVIPNPLHTQISGDHYKHLKIQPFEYIMANTIPYSEGNIIKYVTRWRNKGGIKDLEKARHYIDLLIAEEAKNG